MPATAVIRRHLRALLLSLAACAAALLSAGSVTAASADTCTVTVTDALGVSSSYPDVDVPAGATSQNDLLRALVNAGAVQPGTVDLGLVTLSDSCSDSSSSNSSSSSGSTTTSTSTTTDAPTPTSATTGSTSPSTVTTTVAPPPSTSSSSTSTSTHTSGSPTITSKTRTTPATSTTRTTTTSTTTRPSTTRTTSTTTSTTRTSTSRPSGSRAERRSTRATTTSTPRARRTTTKRQKTPTTKRQKTPTTKRQKTQTTTGNPLLKSITTGSLTLDATPTFVPDFFIDSFEIPPFLLPIYQAAGIEYQLPWQVLAAINQIETDYGRNLSVSSAGAVGWMQFMPSTWKTWGVDATGSGVADPYNPVDAIFAAARYLHAAGASTNLSRAIFAYNHAGWYVQSVLLRAKLIGGVPDQLINSLSDLVEGRFPVAAKAKYADDEVISQANRQIHGADAADAVNSDNSTGTAVFAKRGSPVIAVNDGKIVALGHSTALGNYVRLQDATGNTYTYAHLGRVSELYASPKPVNVAGKDIASEVAMPKVKAPTRAASAGTQDAVRVSGTTITPTTATRHVRDASVQTARSKRSTRHADSESGMVKERLFAHPARRASYAAGGRRQLHERARTLTSFGDYFSSTTLHLARDQYTLRRLKVGSIVVAGTILGRIGARSRRAASHLWFQIQPAGRHSPDIDPKPILDGWKLLAATDIYRARENDAFYSSESRNPSVGQVLLMSKQQLVERVLSDPHVRIYACGRRDIAAGLVDRRVLAVLEYLSDSGLHPTVSGLVCDAGSANIDAAGKTGESVDISAINGIAISGHQGPGSIAAATIRRLLSLQGSMAPDDIVTDTAFKGQSTTIALPDHADRIQISYTPFYGADRTQSLQAGAYLKPAQWTRLIDQISTIAEPSVPIAPGKYAIKR
jgi:murein DD-endopeptidase MepM/ murein hydrolase activator NlpD